MGYFSNGTEGISYLETYCFKCINWQIDKKTRIGGCYVWDLHLEYSTELCNKKDNEGKQMLDFLIPIKDCQNQECKMFIKKKGD